MRLTASHVQTETMPMLFTSRQGHEMNNVSRYGYVCFLHEMHQASNTRLGSVGCQQLDSGLSAARQGLENPISSRNFLFILHLEGFVLMVMEFEIPIIHMCEKSINKC
jgi:hypothetical protein